MPRWVWFAPLGLLVGLGALMAFRLGWIAAHLTETEAIEAYARRHAQTFGEAPNCVAFPGRDVWLVVRCGQGDSLRTYHVNRFGGLVREHAPDTLQPAQGAPRT